MKHKGKRNATWSAWLCLTAGFAVATAAVGVASATDECSWRPVEKARINSHQRGRPWCYPGEFMVAFDLDGPRNYATHDSPVVGQAYCCRPGSDGGWGRTDWTGVWQRGLNSHQPGEPWCEPGSFLVALDLDGPRNLAPYDSPVVGAALCAQFDGRTSWPGQRFWVPVEETGKNSHQPFGRWCPEGSYLVAFDQDSRREYAALDSPVIGQALCAWR